MSNIRLVAYANHNIIISSDSIKVEAFVMLLGAM